MTDTPNDVTAYDVRAMALVAMELEELVTIASQPDGLTDRIDSYSLPVLRGLLSLAVLHLAREDAP